MTTRYRLYLIGIVFALLVGAGLRIQGLYAMRDMLQYDEAYYAVNAISLLEQPRLQFFFPENTGREGLWMYIEAAAIAVWGATPFTLRYVGVMTAIVSLAALMRLGREVLGRNGAVWAGLALGVLYLHVHNSHVPFRVLLYPLVGSLALTAFFIAQRTNQLKHWRTAGVWVGLLSFTYNAAHGWVVYCLLWALWWAWRNPAQRRGIAQMTALALLLAVPMMIAVVTNPASDGGLSRTLVPDAAELQLNVQHWLEAWRGRSDYNPNHNLPYLAILDEPQAFLAIVGLVGLWWIVRPRWRIVFFMGLFFLALLPSLITIRTPQYIRAFGMVVPLALCIGAGAVGIERFMHAVGSRLALSAPPRTISTRTMQGLFTRTTLVLSLLLFALFLWSASLTYGNFQTWLANYRMVLYIDDRINAPMEVIRTQAAPHLPIYIPQLEHHPVAEFHAYGMGRELRFYSLPDDPTACSVLANQPALYLELPIVVNHFLPRLTPYGTVTTLTEKTEGSDVLYRVVEFSPTLTDDAAHTAQVGEYLTLQTVEATPITTQAGQTVNFALAFRQQAALPSRPYRLFIHLQGNPTPYEGGELYATGDTPLCGMLYQSPLPDFSETFVQNFQLSIPPDVPAGKYHLAVGIYDPESPTYERLPIQQPNEETRYYRAVEVILES